MTPRWKMLPLVPASFFGIVLGLAALANLWRAAHALWGMPTAIGEALFAVAALAWILIAFLYAAKWVIVPGEARAESEHAVQCCFIGLGGVTTLLIAQGALPYSRVVAILMFVLGGAFTLWFGALAQGLAVARPA